MYISALILTALPPDHLNFQSSTPEVASGGYHSNTFILLSSQALFLPQFF